MAVMAWAGAAWGAEGPPVAVKYELQADGFVTVAINAADGTRVRNLVTRQWRAKGTHSEAWDLTDDQGRPVGPADYKWVAITHPGLGLRYEMTAYPNVQNYFPDQPAWPTGPHGAGGWGTNHTPPGALATVGGSLYVGSRVAEGGAALFETDLAGRKLWGTGNFTNWTGPEFLAANQKTVFAAARTNGTDNDVTYVMDRESRAIKPLVSLRPSADRDRKVVGLAASESEVFLSSRTEPGRLVGAISADDVDFGNSLPRLPVKRKERVPHEIVPDPRGDWLGLFRILGRVPGQSLSGGHLVALESTRGPGQTQHIVLAFKRPVPIGSMVLPWPTGPGVKATLSVLKPDAAFPGNPGKPEVWEAFETQPVRAWDVAVAKAGTMTRALRITLTSGGGDLLALTDRSADFAGPNGPAEGRSRGDAGWVGKIDGMKVLRGRFANIAGSAQVRVNSGVVSPDGVWDARRKAPVSQEAPGVYVMAWSEPQTIAGLAFKEIDGKRTEIDVFSGEGPLALEGDEGWENVATYEQGRRKHRWGGGNLTEQYARYLDGYVDLGTPVRTKAIRLRVVEQWTQTGSNPSYGLRADMGAMELDPTRCRVFGVAVLSYLGGEPAIDASKFERIEAYEATTGKLLRAFHLARPGQIALDAKGALIAVSNGKIVRVDPVTGEAKVLVEDPGTPGALAVDGSGNIYCFDKGMRQNIQVYDAAGKPTGSIGKEGGRKVGPWDAQAMKNVTSIAVDLQGHVWAAEANMWPKRVTQWDAGGKLIKEVLGPTQYGGGGVLDPWDKARLFYGPLEFSLDWKTGRTQLKSWTWEGALPGELPVHLNGRVYLVNRPEGSLPEMPVGAVYLLENQKARMVAAMGDSEKFPGLAGPAVRKAIGRAILKNTRFLWMDINGNGQVDAGEVTFTDVPEGVRPAGIANFGRDLCAQSGEVRYQVTGFYPNGTPMYQPERFPIGDAKGFSGVGVMRLENGNFAAIGSKGSQTCVTPEGKTLWTYPTEGAGVHSLYKAGPWSPSQVVSEFSWVGHETEPKGDLGEFLVASSNVGTWNVWTADGLLAGQVFKDMRAPGKRPWSMDEASRGLNLDDVTVGQEHFQGYLGKSLEDGRYYAVAGHLHASVVEVLGLDGFRRMSGEMKVSPELVSKANAWDRGQKKAQLAKEPMTMDCPKLSGAPALDAGPEGWGFTSASIGKDKDISLSMAYTDKALFLRYEVRGAGPMINTGQDWDMLFKTGACVDLQIGVDPDAPEERQAPVKGDMRVLMTVTKEGPVAVVYRPVGINGMVGEGWRVESPLSELRFDQVSRAEGFKAVLQEARGGREKGYVFSAMIPLKEIGLKPVEGMTLRMDWGVLESGPQGREVLRRVYWANKATAIVSDAPSEAAIWPAMWGHVRFTGRPPGPGQPGDEPVGSDGFDFKERGF